MTDEQLKIERAKALQFDDLRFALHYLYIAVKGGEGIDLDDAIFNASMVLTTANLLKRQERKILESA